MYIIMLKILIVGYGSIGQRHYNLLRTNKNNKIKILTNSNFKQNNFIERKDISKFNPKYVIISSHTSNHFKDLKFINEKLKNSTILVEKPLFNKNIKFRNSYKNKIFINYNLRFHPIINFIKNYIKNKKLIYCSMNCYSFLPNWRNNIDYKNSNSAKKKLGGGVALELSHEIDLANYLFQIKKIISSYNKKISNLEIDTDDILNVNFICKKISFCNLQLNFFDRLHERKIRIVTKNSTIIGDLINNIVTIKNKKNTKKKYFSIDNNFTYREVHKNIIQNNFINMCSLKEGLKLMSLISKVKKR